MGLTPDNIILIGSIIFFISIIISRLSVRFGIPTLFLFLLVGMIFGSDGLGLELNSPKIAQFIGMISLSIILFSGGMDTCYREIKPILIQGITLSTLGVFLTAFITGVFIFWVTGLNPENWRLSLAASLLLAAVMSSTDSASVFNILRTQKIKLKYNLRPTLEFESGSNDPMAYMLTIALLQVLSSDSLSLGTVVLNFFLQFIIGGVMGFIVGFLAVRILRKANIPYPSLYPLLLLSIVLFAFSLTDILGGNGYLAVYIAGIIVGNKPIILRKEMAIAFDSFTMLAQMVMFLTLGLLVNPSELIYILPLGILIGVFLIFFSRPLSVFISLIPFRKINFKSKFFVSWVGLRGAVPIIFATYPVIAKIEHSELLFNIVFVVTLLSLTLQGMSISWIAKKLNLSLPLEEAKSDFGIEMPEGLNVKVREIKLTDKMLQEKGRTLKDMPIPEKTLVIMIKRGEKFLVPNGALELIEDDILLVIAEEDKPKLRK